MADTLNNLLDHAEAGMRERGYHAVSFRDLADELGIKSASVHYYFRKKEDLGIAVIERYSNTFFQQLEEDSKDAPTSAQKLAAFCNVYKHALEENNRICLCAMLGAESHGLTSELASRLQQFFNDNINWVASALPDTLSAQERIDKATQIVATLQGAMVIANTLGDTQILTTAADQLLHSEGAL